jgi:acyl-CoA synthetase (AMP-forming)/AMP-acid ligase II
MKEHPGQILKESCRHTVGLSGDIILRNALFRGKQEAFIYGDQRITFNQYNDRVNSLIHALHDMGMKNGDVIGVVSWNCLDYADVFGVAGKGGFIVSPFNARASAKELEYLINDCGTSTLFVGPELADMVNILKPNIPKVKYFISFEVSLPGMLSHADLQARYPTHEPDVEVKDDSPLLLLYTSGTTGVPKGALYTHGRWREDILDHLIEMPIKPEDKGLLIMPYFHIGGTIWHSVFFHRGASNVIMKSFDPKATLQAIEDERITSLCVVPTHIAVLLDLPELNRYDTSSIKRVKYVGSPMPAELLKKAISIWGPIFLQAYGQTESGPDIAFLKEEEHDVIDRPPREQGRLLSCGRPALDVHVRIVDDKGNDVPVGEIGEIIVQSRHIMKEYWNKPKQTTDTIVDGWLHTGDMGRYDKEGFIYLADRKHDMIISGGENIYPREVEEVLYQHPAVFECAVFGIPAPKWVETVHAVVSLKKGAEVTPEELIEFCKKNIARYKAPKSIEIVQEIPKSATGKILKKEIRKNYWLGTERRI